MPEKNKDNGSAQSKTLSQKQERFVQNYAACMSATAAAHKAGYKGDSARVTACNALKNPVILEAIEEAKQEYIQKVQLDNSFVLENLIEIAQLYKTDVRLSAQSTKALELLGKYLKLFDTETKNLKMSHEEMLEYLE